MAKSPTDAFRARLQEARKAAGLSLALLAERLEKLGYPLHLTALGKIESGDRKVTLDDAVAIAAALDVSPLHLIFPIDGEDVRLTPSLTYDYGLVRAWARGERPLNPADQNVRFYASQSPLSSWRDLEVMRAELVGEGAPEQSTETEAVT